MDFAVKAMMLFLLCGLMFLAGFIAGIKVHMEVLRETDIA